MSARVGGLRARPRVVVVGEWSDADIRAFQQRFSSLEVVTDGVVSEHPDEVDLLIGDDSVVDAMYIEFRSSHQIAFGCKKYRAIPFRLMSCKRREFTLPAVSPNLHAARVDWLPDDSDARGRSVVVDPRGGIVTEEELLMGALAWSSDPPGPLATVTWREAANRGLAIIPTGKNRVAWVDAILTEWAPKDREAFASLPVWREQSAWLTADERRVAAALADVATRRAAALAALDAEAQGLERARLDARTRADAGLRRLLTTQADDLVNAVAEVFRDLGFEVEAGDPPGGKKRQDLTVRSEGFVAVVEVKGYEKSGAKGSDLTQLERHRTAFVRAHPDAEPVAWLVVNSQFGLAPDARQAPFASDPEQIEQAGQNDTLVIPTTALFRAFRDEAPTALRDRLVAARGLFGVAS